MQNVAINMNHWGPLLEALRTTSEHHTHTSKLVLSQKCTRTKKAPEHSQKSLNFIGIPFIDLISTKKIRLRRAPYRE